MDYNSCDVGFATDKRRWFVTFFSKTRWIRGAYEVAQKISLKNTTIDTYAWADQQNENLSHGRFRFYNVNTQIKGTVNGDVENIEVSGSNPKLKFRHLKGIPTIWYSVKDMEWIIAINGEKLFTRDFKGNISGEFTKDPIRFVGNEEIDIYYHYTITLLDADLSI